MATILTGYQTDVYLNLSKSEMNELRKNVILNEKTHENCSTFVFIIIAHGLEDNVCYDTDDKSTGVVRKVLDVNGNVAWNMNTVEHQLNGVETLKGKPKLVIVEACRGRKRNKCATTKNITVVEKESTKNMLDSELDSEDDEDDKHLELIQPKDLSLIHI